MEFKAVVSSNVQGVAYDEDASELYVEFKGGARYKYRGVPKDIYEGLLDASSPGGYMNDYVKGVYPHSRA